MSVVFDHREAGTPEAAWAGVGAAAVPLEVPERLIVFAAHPDDETLGAGGLMALASAAGAEISVIVATDGEAAHAGDLVGGDLAAVRRGELAAALRHVAPRARIRFLALPDGGLREHTAELAAAIAQEIAAVDVTTTLVATTWWGDGHRDHRVLGEEVCAAARGAVVVGYPIWYWHWGDPEQPDPGPWRTVDLDPDAVAAKTAAIAAFASQAAGPEPILHSGMLAHFRRPVELFISAQPAPARSSVPPEEFDAFISRHDDPWGFETRWYEERKRALLLASLPRPRFDTGLELGCATGVLTAELAKRCDRLVAVDASAEALRRAESRVAGVEFARRTLPAQWPDGTFDLIVLSEIAYYWSTADLRVALQRVTTSLAPGGVLVACHWRHPIEGAPLDGPAVHAALSHAGLTALSRHAEDDFLLDVWAAPGSPSVAQAEGLR